jgi:hypothetical protein
MTRKWRGIAVLAALAAFAALNAGQALATETLAFVPHSGKFPVKNVSAKASELLFNEEGSSYGCGATTGEGEITSAKAGWLKLKLTGCKEVISHESFNSPGAKAGEVITEKVPVELVYSSKSKHEAALDLNYQAPSEKAKTFMTWELAGYKGCGVRGPVLAGVTPVNSAVTTHKAKLQVESSGLQTLYQYETEAGSKYKAQPEVNLACDFWGEGGVGSTGGQTVELSTTVGEGALEIKA